MLGTSWAHVEPMLAYVRRMLAYVGSMLGLCWRMLAPCWLYVEPSWRLCWAYVGDMLAILGLCWGYVRQFMLKKSSDTTFYGFSFPQSKNTGKTYVF